MTQEEIEKFGIKEKLRMAEEERSQIELTSDKSRRER